MVVVLLALPATKCAQGLGRSPSPEAGIPGDHRNSLWGFSTPDFIIRAAKLALSRVCGVQGGGDQTKRVARIQGVVVEFCFPTKRMSTIQNPTIRYFALLVGNVYLLGRTWVL